LDVLINNAGIHLNLLSQWPAPALSADGIELQWRTNYLGSLHLSHLLLPLLVSMAKKTGDARIVNVVSMLHSRGRNDQFFEPNRPYSSLDVCGQSKLPRTASSFFVYIPVRCSPV
jgi:retinol dehydrogenase-12